MEEVAHRVDEDPAGINCKHCYAERLAERLQAMGNPRYRDGFKLTLHLDQLTLPLRWHHGRMNGKSLELH